MVKKRKNIGNKKNIAKTWQTKGEIIIYNPDNGGVKLEVRLENETVWLTQQMMAELFGTSIPNVNIHIKNIINEGELQENSVIKDFLITASDGKNYNTKFYNLDMIISVGYRIKSAIATRFRIWATQRLKEYIIKGFAMDDERLKRAGGGNYFEELLKRIRDIRSSEKIFWRKVLDIYATSMDYDPHDDVSKKFFATIQNKMHWAAHGQTAAEIIYGRADASKPNMGMTNWVGSGISKPESEIAKNYLKADELDMLNRIVTLYLEFAEIQAINRKPMSMKDWIDKLDEFLKITGRNILTHAGAISHDKALQKAHAEFEKYTVTRLSAPSNAEQDFLEAEKKIKLLGKPGNTAPGKKGKKGRQNEPGKRRKNGE